MFVRSRRRRYSHLKRRRLIGFLLEIINCCIETKPSRFGLGKQLSWFRENMPTNNSIIYVDSRGHICSLIDISYLVMLRYMECKFVTVILGIARV